MNSLPITFLHWTHILEARSRFRSMVLGLRLRFGFFLDSNRFYSSRFSGQTCAYCTYCFALRSFVWTVGLVVGSRRHTPPTFLPLLLLRSPHFPASAAARQRTGDAAKCYLSATTHQKKPPGIGRQRSHMFSPCDIFGTGCGRGAETEQT